MSTFNLIRNSRVWFTTNVASGTGIVAGSSFTAANTQELQVLDGFSFNQASNADTITLNEAGANPVRGQRSFNTSLANVEFSFSTYIRPRLDTTVKCEESCLWNSLLSTSAISTANSEIFGGAGVSGITLSGAVLTITGTAMDVSSLVVGNIYVVKGITGTSATEYNTAIKLVTKTATSITGSYLITPTVGPGAGVAVGTTALRLSQNAWNEHVAYSEITTAFSQKNQLLPFGMLIAADGIVYAIDNAALDQAVIDFGLDGIAMVAWTGKGTALRQITTGTGTSTDATAAGTFDSGGAVTGSFTAKNTAASFITNKLSTVTLKSNIGGISGTTYTLALTGGSITIANNLTYLTPANLGVINKPISYYTGTRAISGSLTAYLRTGSTNTAGLMAGILTASAIEPKFKLQVELGGSSNATRVEFEVNSAFLQTPTIDAAAVMSTTINFTAEGAETAQSATSAFDIENPTELEVRYFAA